MKACVLGARIARYASNTFSMESDFGRARVVDQWADDKETIEIAIDIVVDCFGSRRDGIAARTLRSFAREKIRELWAEEGAKVVHRGPRLIHSVQPKFLKRFDENGELFGKNLRISSRGDERLRPQLPKPGCLLKKYDKKVGRISNTNSTLASEIARSKIVVPEDSSIIILQCIVLVLALYQNRKYAFRR